MFFVCFSREFGRSGFLYCSQIQSPFSIHVVLALGFVKEEWSPAETTLLEYVYTLCVKFISNVNSS